MYFYSAVVTLQIPQTDPASPASGYAPSEYVFAGVILLIVGLYFLRGASHLVRFAYGADSVDSDDTHHAA